MVQRGCVGPTAALLSHQQTMSALGIWAEGTDLLSRVVYGPLAALYFNGPGLLGWKGRAPTDVCAAISGVQASFWRDNPDGCAEILITSFSAWVTVLNCIFVYGGAAWGFIRLLSRSSMQQHAGQVRYCVLPQQPRRRLLLSPSTSARYRRKGLRCSHQAAGSGSDTG